MAALDSLYHFKPMPPYLFFAARFVGVPGFVVFIFILLKLARLLSAGMDKELIEFPAASFSVASVESAIDFTSKSSLASPDCTV